MNDNNSIKRLNEAMDDLNERQRMAVEQIEGPVLVIAGPGTGKTQILAARIASILERTDTLPEQILCLTYTDAGTVAMRNRLLQFIGPDAYRVAIHTFHAFCNRVIQENLDDFGMKALDAVSELDQKAYVRSIIDAFPKNHPLKRYGGDIYFDADKLLNLYEVMKREDWTPEWILQKTDEYIRSLEDNEDYQYKRDSKHGKKGEWKKNYFEEIKRMDQLKAAVETFPDYQKELKKHGRYDFADMILWVIEAFRLKPAMLMNYQEQYQYFLVDEFQDTSGSQNHLLKLLINYWDTPNIFCVGDDDQSIFRFQGANVENILEFVNEYHPQKISLNENYRSSSFILDAAKVCIGHNKNRIDPDKTLLASGKNVQGIAIRPEVRKYLNPVHEVVHIATEIQSLISSGVPGNEIAVLYRRHQQASEMIDFLRAQKVPINSRKRVNILEEPLIRQLLRILRYLSAEKKKPHSGEVYLYELLHFEFLNLKPLDIARISTDVYRKNFKERVTSWREELATSSKKADLFSSTDGNGLKRTSLMLENWISSSMNLTVQQLIEMVLTESGILAEALTSGEKLWKMELLHTFFGFVKEECSRKPKTGLTELIETIDLMEEEKVGLQVEKILASGSGVNFMSIHASKGLEFDRVYLIGCNSNKWEKARAVNHQFKLPTNLFELEAVGDDEEIRRLFYVALTRAKTHLIVSYSLQDKDAKDIEKSRFAAEFEEAESAEISNKEASNDQILSFETSLMKFHQEEKRIDLFDHELADELLADYTLSVTHLNTYLRCPTAFYFNNLIRVPAPLSANMTFGSAVHHALEQLFKKMNIHPEKAFPSSAELVDDFKWYMRRNEEAFTRAEYDRRIEYGESMLPAYYNHYLNEWNKVTSVERTYRNVVVEGVPLNGKLDKLEFEGKKVNVVDYKTGNFHKSKKKFSRPVTEETNQKSANGKDPSNLEKYGGDYWRQAVFYKILMDNDPTRDWEMLRAEFDFVEPDKDTKQFHKQPVNIEPKDIEIVKLQIHIAYEGIKTKQFDKGCQEPDCEWCTFVNEYYHKGKKVLIKSEPQDEE